MKVIMLLSEEEMTSYIRQLFRVTKDVVVEDDDNDTSSESDVPEDDSSEEVNISEYVLGTPLYSSTVFEDIAYSKYVCDFRKIAPNVQNWAYNRKVDMKHVDNLFSHLTEMKHPHLIGSLKLVRDTATDTLTLLDGQHRVMAMLKLMQHDPHVKMDVEVDVYNIANIETSDIELQELFLKANNNRNVLVDDLPEKKVIEIINKMIEIWPQNIKTKDDKGAIKPNVTKKELYEHLKQRFNACPALCKKTPQEVLKSIVNINLQLRLKPLKELFGREAPSKRKVSMYERAKKHDFFLNLDCKYNLEKWVQML